MAGSTARVRQLVPFHTEGLVYRLESEEHSMVADIGLEVVVAADTVPEVEVVGTVPEVVESIVPVVVVAADTVLGPVVAADTVLAVSQRLGSDMVLAVYDPQQISFAVLMDAALTKNLG